MQSGEGENEGKEAKPVEIIGEPSSMETADRYTNTMTSEGKANF